MRNLILLFATVGMLGACINTDYGTGYDTLQEANANCSHVRMNRDYYYCG